MNSITEGQLVAAEERLRLAMLRSDVATLDELLAPDLVFTTHQGQVLGKEDDLAAHRSGQFRIDELTLLDQRIHMAEGVAIVSALMRVAGTYAGEAFASKLRYTRVWSLSPMGPRQILAGHACAVPAE
jgi:ketosteroid isomerase-like protein